MFLDFLLLYFRLLKWPVIYIWLWIKDQSVTTDPDDTEQGESSSKKDIVKRKWNKFKSNVKRKSPQNPLNILRRRASNASSSDESEYHTDLEEDQVEENVQLPVISNEGYYWLGKDYSNTYKADFKDVADFSSGKGSLKTLSFPILNS